MAFSPADMARLVQERSAALAVEQPRQEPVIPKSASPVGPVLSAPTRYILERSGLPHLSPLYGNAEYRAALELEGAFAEMVAVAVIICVQERLKRLRSTTCAPVYDLQSLRIEGVTLATWAAHRSPDDISAGYAKIFGAAAIRVAAQLNLEPSQVRITLDADRNRIDTRFEAPVCPPPR